MKKIALITGVTGQDGAYLAELLLSKGYQVHGIRRRSSSINTERINHLNVDPCKNKKNFFLHYGDMTDSTNLIRLIQKIQPNEIYNLAAQSHVMISFETAEYTSNVDALGTLRILEAIRILGMEKKIKYYQASTSELYGKIQGSPQNESTPFYPRSPYAVAKLYAYWITVNYREAYKIHASNGILFNHESPKRNENFVTRKIIKSAVGIYKNNLKCLYLGNLNASRDWGHARDYVRGMWLMLQQKVPDDYVFATGKTFTVRHFVERTFLQLGIKIIWKDKGLKEYGINEKNGEILIRIDPRYFRPTEVDLLIGDATKAKKKLGWEPKISLDDLIKEMVEEEMKN